MKNEESPSYDELKQRLEAVEAELLAIREGHLGAGAGECKAQMAPATDDSARKLEESHRYLDFVIEGSGVGIWEWNVQTNETRFNEQWAAMLGYTLAELTPYDYATWERFVHPEDIEQACQALADCAEGRTSEYQCEFRMKHKDGHWVWILDRGRIMTLDDAGQPLTMYGTHTDITEIKQAEESLARHLAFEQAISAASTCLLGTEMSDTVVTGALEPLLGATGVSRVYIFQNFEDPDDGLCMRQTFEVCAAGVEPEIDNPELQHVVYAQGFGRWRERLTQGEAIQGEVRAFPAKERAVLEPQGIVSMLVLPIVVGGRWWGFIGFDETRQPRAWQDAEVALLKTAAEMLGTFFTRKQVEQEREKLVHELGERVKELSCVFGVSEAIRMHGGDEKVFEQVAGLIPPGWHYPEITRARIRFDHLEFVSGPFEETEWRQAADILVAGQRRGCVEVYYTEERPVLEEGPFLTEERNLIDGIAHLLGDSIQTAETLEALRKEREQLLSIFNSAEAVIYISDPKTHELLYANRFLQEQLPPDYLGKKCYNLLQNLDAPCPFCTNDIILKQKPESYQWEFHNTNFDRHYAITDRIILWPDGRDVRFEMAIDITERKQAEEALRQKHAMLTRTEAVAQVGSWEWEAEGDKVTWSEELFRIFGLEPAEEAPSFAEHQAFYVPEDRARLLQAVEECMKTGVPYDLEARLIRPDGELRHCVVRGIPERDADGVVKRLYGSLHDITERKKVEVQLQSLANIIERSHDFIGIADSGQAAFFVNPAGQRMVGIEGDEEAASTRIQDYFLPEDLPYVENTILPVVMKDGRWAGEFQFRHFKTGKAIPVLYDLFLTENPSTGEMTNLATVTRDITERKQAEEERESHLRFLQSMVEVNQIIQQTEETEQMMSDVLRAAVEIFQTDRAWLLYPCDPEATSWSVPMEYTRSEYPGARSFAQEIAMLPKDADVFRQALAENDVRTIDYRQPGMAKETSELFGTLSEINMAIHPRRGKPWLFGMHQCSHARTWTPEDINLFREIGYRLGDGLSNMLLLRDLRESEGKHRLLADNTVDVIWLMDMDLRFVYVNPAVLALTGYTVSEWEGTRLSDHCDEEAFGQMAGIIEAEVAKGPRQEGVVFESEMRRKDGTAIAVAIHGKIIFDESGAPQFLQGVTRDISERKAAEEALRAVEKRNQALLDYSPACHKIVDLDFNLQYMSQSGFRMLKLDENATIYGKPYPFNFFPATFREKMKNCLEQVKTTEETVTLEGLANDVEGHDVWLHSTLVPVFNENGQLDYITVVSADLTQEKRLENDLLQSQKMESVGRLAGGVAHDFNNMLNVILGRTELAMEGLPADSPLGAHLDEVRQAAQRSANLTRQLLAFARKQTVAPRILDLNEAIAPMLKMLERLIGEDIDLLWRPGPRLALVRIDPGQVDQILANLAVNARDAIGHAHGKVTIETANIQVDEDFCLNRAEFTPGDYVLLAVSDDGCGMDAETCANIFEPFFTTKGVGEGTGLGLATVYGIVRQNHGFVNVYSEPDKGTTFRVYLPATEEFSQARSDSQTAAKELVGGDETILVVEDEVAILKMIRPMLERLGYRVLTASVISEATRLVQEQSGKIDLIIADVVMPEKNGRELVESLREYCPDVRCLFMSGYTANVIAHQGVLEEDVNFIQKPFSPAGLAQKVREVLES